MRILGINGSPRERGNTAILVARVLEGARAAGAETQMLFLGDLTIRECDGCHACWQGRPCAKKDDMAALYECIADSDVLVFGTPVYWYGPTALMKAFIDRLVFFNCPEHRAKIRGKRAAVVSPFEEPDPQAASLLVFLFEKCFEYLELCPSGTLLVPGLTRKGEVREKEGTMAEAYVLGKALVQRGSAPG